MSDPRRDVIHADFLIRFLERLEYSGVFGEGRRIVFNILLAEAEAMKEEALERIDKGDLISIEEHNAKATSKSSFSTNEVPMNVACPKCGKRIVRSSMGMMRGGQTESQARCSDITCDWNGVVFL